MKKNNHPRQANSVDAHVGSRIKVRRLSLNISQEKLGEELGVTFQQVQKYERGSNRVGASRLWRLAQVLQVPVHYFFEGLSDPDDLSLSDMPSSAIYEFIVSHDGVAFAEALTPISKPIRRSLLEHIRALSNHSFTINLEGE